MTDDITLKIMDEDVTSDDFVSLYLNIIECNVLNMFTLMISIHI